MMSGTSTGSSEGGQHPASKPGHTDDRSMVSPSAYPRESFWGVKLGALEALREAGLRDRVASFGTAAWNDRFADGIDPVRERPEPTPGPLARGMAGLRRQGTGVAGSS
jgi:hypothetical protein